MARRTSPRPSGSPESPLATGTKAPAGWAEKIAKAIKARESAKEARRGRPVGFPHSFSRQPR